VCRGVLLRWVALAAPLWLAAVLLVACASGVLSGGRPPTIADLAVTPRRRTPAARVSAPDLHHGQQTIWVVVVVVV
jgi:hypothetical protein